MKLIEPQRGVDMLQSLNTRTSMSQARFSLMSFFSDATVLLFPLALVALYFYHYNKGTKQYKITALRIFASTIVAALINIMFQFFFNKTRPETALEGAERLVLKHLPTMSFPSDHAAVGLAFGIAMVIFVSYRSHSKQKSYMLGAGVFFLLAGLVMSVARVAVGIHWPTDILAGWVVAIIAVLITKNIPEGIFLQLIRLEKKIFSFLYK